MRAFLLLAAANFVCVSSFVCPPRAIRTSASGRGCGVYMNARGGKSEKNIVGRQDVLRVSAFAIASAAAQRVQAAPPSPALVAQAQGKKDIGISDEELRKKLEYDIVTNQFMVTDEIDTYTLDKWIQGTGLLFKNDYSKMELDGQISITDEEATFRFKEQLMFNIPILKPKVPLTGKLVLTRGDGGLFTSYKESWDQSVAKVLLSSKLF